MLLAISLFFYSFTQVDLNLTLSQASIFQSIEKTFQYIGWFNRPLSTAIFVAILLLLAIGYWLTLDVIRKGNLTVRQFWQIVLPISAILLFAYNAFSYDLFNYMFDAKMVTMYNENPYLHKALDFPTDPWINFMRWTHRTYPYGPTWLGLTIPLSFLGMQFFLPTLFLFKALMVASYLGCVYFIGKIMEKTNPTGKLFAMAAFALNPLIIIESLVSAHHDVVMMFLALLSFFYLLNKKYIRALILLILSIGVKFATVLLIPVFLYVLFRQIKKASVDWDMVWKFSVLLMLVAVVLSSFRTELQPWYFVWVLPFVGFIKDKRFVIVSTIISVGLLLHYVGFLYTGNWDPPIPTIKLLVTIGSIVLATAGFFLIKKDAVY